MDNLALDSLLSDEAEPQFWLKPIGPPRDHSDWNAPEYRTWSHSPIEIHFAKSPAKVAVGAILIAYRVRIQKLIYVGRRLPLEEWGPAEVRSEYSRQRWPYFIKARNLTPEYGGAWDRYNLQPFVLAREYNAQHPEEPVSLGGILRGNDKAALPSPFAEYLIRSIREIV